MYTRRSLWGSSILVFYYREAPGRILGEELPSNTHQPSDASNPSMPTNIVDLQGQGHLTLFLFLQMPFLTHIRIFGVPFTANKVTTSFESDLFYIFQPCPHKLLWYTFRNLTPKLVMRCMAWVNFCAKFGGPAVQLSGQTHTNKWH